ncbi:MAG: hypothetical protein NTX22_16610 [Ignavibacteriales bacterium]|nr:hypothetical protein [Ignavibacteriales bacterium]
MKKIISFLIRISTFHLCLAAQSICTKTSNKQWESIHNFVNAFFAIINHLIDRVLTNNYRIVHLLTLNSISIAFLKYISNSFTFINNQSLQSTII